MVGNADVILALDLGDLFGRRRRVRGHRGTSIVAPHPARRKVMISSIPNCSAARETIRTSSAFSKPTLPVAADSPTTLPYLTEAVNSAMSTARRNENPEREARNACGIPSQAHDRPSRGRRRLGCHADQHRALGMEFWAQIKGDDLALVSRQRFQSSWPNRLWDFTQYHQFIGGSGAAGIGYSGRRAVGAASRTQTTAAICVSFQGDGDFMMGPGAMWTAAHHQFRC